MLWNGGAAEWPGGTEAIDPFDVLALGQRVACSLGGGQVNRR